MLKKILFLILILIPISLSYASDNEQLTITTYYPSPYGSYNELSTYNNTYLATQGGNVGIGTSNPQAKLDVSSTTSGFLPPRVNNTQMQAIASPVSGMLVYNSDDARLYLYTNSSWRVMEVYNPKWTPVNIDLGVLRTTVGTSIYDLSSYSQLSNAKEILVYLYCETGSGARDQISEWKVYTKESSGAEYDGFLRIHTWDQEAWSYNSDNLWFPVTPDKKLYVYFPANFDATHIETGIRIIGYK